MKKLILILILAGLSRTAAAGLIFDNGTGAANDTLVIQFCFLDSLGLDYNAWDTTYVRQCYGGVAFRQVTLTSPTTYDIGSSWPSTMMFEWRSRASDSLGHTGAYTWWALVSKNYNGKRVRQMHSGSYYVNSDPIEDILVAGDTAAGNPLYRMWKTYDFTDGDGSQGIDADIDALSLTGGGTEACTLFARQDSTAPIQSARIVIRTLDQSATKVPGLFTDVEGKGIAELDPASYFISITANNYMPLGDTLVVSQDASWEFSLTPYDPGNPPSPELCRVYGWIYDIGGVNLADVTISAEIPAEFQPVKFDDIIITPFRKSTRSDSTGYWEIDLFPNSLLSRPDSKYQFVFEYPSGVFLKSKAMVPDTLTWLFR